MSVPKQKQLQELLPYLTEQERAEMNRLISEALPEIWAIEYVIVKPVLKNGVHVRDEHGRPITEEVDRIVRYVDQRR